MTELYEKALTLGPASRWALAERLLASIPLDSPPEVEDFWRKEVRERLHELRSKTVDLVTWENTIADMERIICE